MRIKAVTEVLSREVGNEYATKQTAVEQDFAHHILDQRSVETDPGLDPQAWTYGVGRANRPAGRD